MNHSWIYLVMLVLGVFMFYFGNEVLARIQKPEWHSKELFAVPHDFNEYVFTEIYLFGEFLTIIGLAGASNSVQKQKTFPPHLVALWMGANHVSQHERYVKAIMVELKKVLHAEL